MNQNGKKRRRYSALVALLLVSIWVAGCARAPAPPTFSNPLDPLNNGLPIPAAPRLEARWGNHRAELIWTSPDTIPPTSYRVYRRLHSEQQFTLIAAISQTSYTDGEPLDRLQYSYMVAGINSSGLEGYPSAAVAVTPLENYFFISDVSGDTVRTNSLDVRLEIHAPLDTTANVRISNDSTFTLPPPNTIDWVPYVGIYYAWRLVLGGDSLKTVYVQFTDVSGQESVIIHDQILYRP